MRELRKIEKYLKGDSILYIGMSRNSNLKWKEYFKGLGFKIFDVLEIFPGNVEVIKEKHPNEFGNIYNIDVRNIDIIDIPIYDLVLWYDGPEHVHCDEIPIILSRMEKKGRMIVIRTCNGELPAGTIYGNTYERHLCFPNPGIFEKLGYNVKYGFRGDRGWILGWKKTGI